MRTNAVRSENVETNVPFDKPMTDPFWRDAVQGKAPRQQGSG